MIVYRPYAESQAVFSFTPSVFPEVFWLESEQNLASYVAGTLLSVKTGTLLPVVVLLFGFLDLVFDNMGLSIFCLRFSAQNDELITPS